ncbi:hypothetical protein L7F22_040705 [Adiantum nelumboides]|nr:hypothetical protein [Adiantum nelumboides]
MTGSQDGDDHILLEDPIANIKEQMAALQKTFSIGLTSMASRLDVLQGNTSSRSQRSTQSVSSSVDSVAHQEEPLKLEVFLPRFSHHKQAVWMPDALGTVPKCQSTLVGWFWAENRDLSGNNLSGQIPSAVFRIDFYNFSGNHLECGSNFSKSCETANSGPASSPINIPSSISDKSSSTGAIVGGVLGSAAFVFCIAVLVIHCERRRRHQEQNRQDVFVDVPAEDDLKIAFGQLKRFPWRELQRATDDFNESNVIGQGAFAKVYKGVLNDHTEIAVKRLLSISPDTGEASFLQEVEMISVAVHRNLLHLLGFCITPSERILVYPFMPNKSVAYRLRDRRNGETALDWNTRKRIALGAARGLEYLHHQCSRKIIHRDVKAANVLLNADYEAVVGDFGLAKLVDTRNTHVTTMVRGTMGHIAPEYLSTGKSSEKTDVFGYGIMLLEFVTGQRAIDLSRLQEENDVLLLDHVKKLQHEKRLDMIVDPELTDFNAQEVEQMIQVALLCAQASPEDRPSMEEVVRMLSGEGLAERWEEWQQVEVIRRREYEAMPHRLAEWVEDSTVNQEAIQLSAAR